MSAKKVLLVVLTVAGWVLVNLGTVLAIVAASGWSGPAQVGAIGATLLIDAFLLLPLLAPDWMP